MLVGSIILAGGRSRRMGQPKESLSYRGTSLLGHTVELLLDCTWPVVVVGRGEDQQLPPFPIEAAVLHDDQPGAGPLPAMATALRFLLQQGELSPQDAVFVTGCDAPFLSPAAVSFLADALQDQQCAMPKVDDHLQPLCAVYRCDILPAIDALLAAGIDTPRTLAERVRTRILTADELRRCDPELRFLRRVNTPEEYQAALAAKPD